MIALLNKVTPGWVKEHRFHPTRKWRFDYANPEMKLAIEIEGGVWVRGRHTRGKGYRNDMEKYNEAVKLGWRVLRYAPDQTRRAIDDVMTMVKIELE